MPVTGRLLIAALGLGLLLPAASAAGDFEGRVLLEMEYLGESYFSEQLLSAEDLGLPPGTSLVVAETTRFADDTWLPGPRLELRWREAGSAADLEILSATALNEERFSHRMEAAVRRDGGAGFWRFRAQTVLRDEKRSLVGDGDWSTRLEAERQQELGALTGALRMSWEHSRLRGDTTSYLYDYDLVRARARLAGGGRWLPEWEASLEGTRKAVPGGGAGAYAEARLGGAWYPGGDLERSLIVEARLRDYDEEGVGRDFSSAEGRWRSRIAGGDRHALGLEAEALVVDYRGEDELYFDSAELSLHLPWRREQGAWGLALGPALRLLRDLGGADRDHLQGTAKGNLSRLGAGGGYAELNLEAGYRDYAAAESEVVEISSLSSTILRSDYWLVDVLALANQPVGRGLSLDLLASLSWEFHRRDSERIHVAFVSLGLSRTF